MCIVCGDMSHEGLELIMKATLTPPKKKVKKELPRFKALADLEQGFKDDFANTMGDMVKEIIKEANKL